MLYSFPFAFVISFHFKSKRNENKEKVAKKAKEKTQTKKVNENETNKQTHSTFLATPLGVKTAIFTCVEPLSLAGSNLCVQEHLRGMYIPGLCFAFSSAAAIF